MPDHKHIFISMETLSDTLSDNIYANKNTVFGCIRIGLLIALQPTYPFFQIKKNILHELS